VNQSVTGPRGFLAAGVVCGLKKSGKKDLGLLVCPTGAVAAGVFTTNKIYSAAVAVCKKHVKSAVVDSEFG
jgi:glutamate N-acetyltransferase/amino-acid N-acetyltransferase